VTHSSLRLLHLTDTHLFADAGSRLRGVETHRTLSLVLEHALQGAHGADAMLVTGDLAQDESAGAYANFRAMLGACGLPVWCLPGNHDAPGFMTEVLADSPFQVGGALDSEAWSVLLLNSHVAGEHGGRLAETELQWLRAALAQRESRHVLLAIHHHVLPLGSLWLDELSLGNAADLLAIIDQAPQVRAVLAGHVHQASELERRGVRYLTTPSTCFQFLPGVDTFAIDRRPPGFRRLALQPDGRIETEVVWIAEP